MSVELIQQALEPLLMHAESMQTGTYSQQALGGMAEGVANIGQQGFEGAKDALLAVAGVYLVFSRMTKHSGHHGGGQAKPAEVREVRARVVRPWESGLLEKNGKFFDSKPVLDEKSGNQVVINGVEQYSEDYYRLITPGFQLKNATNLLRPRTRMILLNNLPQETTFKQVNFKNKDDDLFTLAGGMPWAHVKAQDEYGRPMKYEYLKAGKANGAARAAGRISVERALLNAIMTSSTKAEVAGQLEIIARPAVIKRLKGESDPDSAASEPEFYEEVERDVHDRFLERGSVLVALGANASLSTEKEAANEIASALRGRSGERTASGEEIAALTPTIVRSSRTA